MAAIISVLVVIFPISAVSQSRVINTGQVVSGCAVSASECVTLIDNELGQLQGALLSTGQLNTQIRVLAASVVRAAREKAPGNRNSQYSIALEKIAAAATNADLGKSVTRAASAIAREKSNSFIPVPAAAASPA